jgi:hypothetical protein
MLGKHTLRPAEKTSLNIVYQTTDRPGPFSKIVTLTTDSSDQQEIEVTVEGTVREMPAANIAVHPRKIVLEGSESGMPVKREFTVSNSGKTPLEITKVFSKATGTVIFDSSKDGAFTVEPQKTKKLELQLRPRVIGEKSRELVVIESNAKNAPKSGYVIMIEHGHGNQ